MRGFLVTSVWIGMWACFVTAALAADRAQLDLSYQYFLSEAKPDNNNSAAALYWIDDESLFFQGYSGPKPRRAADADALQRNLYLWRMGETPKIHVAGTSPDYLSRRLHCGSSGFLRYETRREAGTGTQRYAIYYKEGTPGAEVEVQLPSYDNPSRTAVQFSRYNCSYVFIPSQKHRRWGPLLPEHGFIDFGSNGGFEDRRNDRDVRLFKPDGVVVRLDIPGNKTSTGCGAYYRFLDIYLFTGCVDSFTPEIVAERRAAACWPYWTVSPSGRSQQHCLPYGIDDYSIREIVLTRSGTFFVDTDVDGSRAYLVEGERRTEIVDGVVENLAVSPNGCRVAMNYARTLLEAKFYFPGEGRTVLVIDVCNPAQ